MGTVRKSRSFGPCKRCSKQFNYVYQVWLHPAEWVRWSTKWMNEYTNQKLLMRFAAFEAASSILAVSFFAWVRVVTDLEHLEFQWIFFNLSMAFRGLYALVGLYGAWHLKVRFTWAFAGMMVVNAVILLAAMLDLSGFSCIRTPDVPLMAPWESHQHWSNNTNQHILLLTYFEIPNPRLYFKTAPDAPPPDCVSIDISTVFDHYDKDYGKYYPASDIEASLLAIRGRRSWIETGATKTNTTDTQDLVAREEGLWTSSPMLLKIMDGSLRKCIYTLDCGLVEVRLQREGSDAADGLSVCLYDLNVVPYVDHTFACSERRADTAEHGCVLPDVSVFFLKDVAQSTRIALAFGQIEDEQEVVCHLSRDILIGILLLLISSNGFMFVIAVKFAMNRCGDHFDSEVQFDVEFSSDDEEYSEDGSWVHSTRGSAESSVSFADLAGQRKSRKSVAARRHSRGSVLKKKSMRRRTFVEKVQVSESKEIEMSKPLEKRFSQQLSPRKSVRFVADVGEGGDEVQLDSSHGPKAPSNWGANWGFT